MRLPRIKLKGRTVVYHCMSRVVGGERLLDDWGRETLIRIVWQMAAYCGLEVITYCIMPNHFHVLVRVPERVEVADAELLARLEGLHGRDGVIPTVARQMMKSRGCLDSRLRERVLSRMGDVSAYMQEVKQRFSRWYNQRHGRFGTLWAERFKSVVVEDQPTHVEAVAAYIDLNPVRAGMVEDPKDYRYCGYATALAGNRLAQHGLLTFLEKRTWQEGAPVYRLRLFVGAGAAHQAGKVALSEEQIQEVVERGGGLSLAEVLRFRLRFMSQGLALGTQAFVAEVGQFHRGKFKKKRSLEPKLVRALAALGLNALRDPPSRCVG